MNSFTPDNSRLAPELIYLIGISRVQSFIPIHFLPFGRIDQMPTKQNKHFFFLSVQFLLYIFTYTHDG